MKIGAVCSLGSAWRREVSKACWGGEILPYIVPLGLEDVFR